jgi:hypothetical protein
MTNPLAINPNFGPVRQKLAKALTVVFVVLLVAMLVLGTIQVLLQIVGLIIGSGDFIVSSAATIGPWTYAIAAAFGTISFFVAWSYGWKGGD